MPKRVLILDGHPDPAQERLVHALAAAYRDGAAEAKHEVMLLRLADLDVPLLRSQADYEHAGPAAGIKHCQDALDWANHLVLLYPLWLGSMPAMLKALLEQMLRPGFAFSTPTLGHAPAKFHEGKTARIVVTTGMPALAYRWFYCAHSLRSLRRNVLRFIGFRHVRSSVIGGVATADAATRRRWLQDMRELGLRSS